MSYLKKTIDVTRKIRSYTRWTTQRCLEVKVRCYCHGLVDLTSYSLINTIISEILILPSHSIVSNYRRTILERTTRFPFYFKFKFFSYLTNWCICLLVINFLFAVFKHELLSLCSPKNFSTELKIESKRWSCNNNTHQKKKKRS